VNYASYENDGTSVLFDIDNDGTKDYCSIGPGPTFGMFTFTFTVMDESRSIVKYENIFYHDPCTLLFKRDTNGAVRLFTEGNDMHSDIHHYDIRIEDGNIILSEYGEDLAPALLN
jgi:hypothetical protein